jgi:septum formation protein
MSAPILYLASKSPRRQTLLAQLDVAFETLLLREAVGRDRDVTEVSGDGEAPADYVLRIARTKAEIGALRMHNRKLAERPVLGADTEVVLDGAVFGKPRDADDAARMLKRLSGRTHHVLTAVALRHGDSTAVELSSSRVTLRRLAAAEIERYARSGEPLDKAGAYAIQGRAAAFVSRIEGSYSGIVGLPLCETALLLARAGVRVL